MNVTVCVQPERILGNVSRSFTSRKQRLPARKKMRQDILRGWLNFSDFYNGVSVIPELYWIEDMLLFFKNTDACLTVSMPNSLTSSVSRSTNSSTQIISNYSGN